MVKEENSPDPVRKKHGMGTYTEGNNSYTGQWNMDAMHGKGKFTFASGAYYEVFEMINYC